MDHLRKKIIYRCRRRGMREADLLLGIFADRHLDQLNRQELIALANLLDHNDIDITHWLHRREDPPFAIDRDLLQKLRQFAYSIKLIDFID